MSIRLSLAAALAVVGIAIGGVAGATSPPDDSAAPPGSAPAAEAGQLVGLWNVVTIGGADVAAIGATLEFTADGRVQGMGGVNSFHGPYTAGAGTIEFGPAVSTLMAGPEPAMAVEEALFAVLDGSQPFAVDGDVLTLGAGESVVELHRASAAPDSAPADPAAAIVTISGTVTYRERIALPEGALVTVQVNDVSAADGPAVPVAEATIVPMHEVPIAYAIAVSASSFEAGHDYALSIGIVAGEDLLFTTTEDLAVTAEPAVQTYDVELSAAGS